MKNEPQSNDPVLAKFDAWLGSATVRPPQDFLQRVRSRLQDAPDSADAWIEELLQPDLSLRDPRMLAKVRQRLADQQPEIAASRIWFPWLAPLAAAATLAFAFFSFQSQVPQQWQRDSGIQNSLANQSSSSLPDEQTTAIFALASNLQGGADLSKLDSVEDLAFLFD